MITDRLATLANKLAISSSCSTSYIGCTSKEKGANLCGKDLKRENHARNRRELSQVCELWQGQNSRERHP
eukprot:1379183-Amphidinium_carterae.1